jgi:minor extracellular serine protease Vpr
MRSCRFPLAVAVLFLALVSLTSAGTLTQSQQTKIHPRFRRLLAAHHPELGFAKSGYPFSIAKRTDESGSVLYETIINVSDPQLLRSAGIPIISSFPGVTTAQLTEDQIVQVAQIEGVKYIQPGETFHKNNDVSVPETGAALLHGGYLGGTQYRGAGVIVLLFDTGLDWKHMDFRLPSDTTKSRVIAIWDQTLTATGGESKPSGFPYGVEYTQAQINAELGPSPPGLVRERDNDGHGTHVAGTVVGNGLALNGKFVGMAPDADILVVKGGDVSFSEEHMIDALDYGASKAASLGEPIVVNWSLGTQFGAHDGSLGDEVALDGFVNTPGRAVCVAAGNDGDLPIHISGSAGNVDISLVVPSYTANLGTGNDLFVFDVWFRSEPQVSVTVTSPHGATASAAYQPSGSTGTGSNINDGTISLDNAPYPPDGGRFIELAVTDDSGTNPGTGTWTLSITNAGSAVPFDGWLALATVGNSSVTLVGGDVNKTVSMPGTANGSITAGAYITKLQWPVYANLQYGYSDPSLEVGDITTFSSHGPTADGRQKPDFAAPGMGIASALSSTADTTGAAGGIYPGQKHWIEQGTSMSTAHATGAAALILGASPTATAADIKALLQETANPDAFTSTVPNYVWGYGKLDVVEALARRLSPSALISRVEYAYDGGGNNNFVELTGSARYAVRISPSTSGKLTSISVNVTTPNNNPIQGNGNLVCEIYSDNGGIPGPRVGSAVLAPLNHLNPGTPNYIQMLNAGASVTAGTDIHAVISLDTPSNILLVRTESVTSGTRSLSFNGSSWVNLSSNVRIRAIVSTDNGVATAGGTLASGPSTYDLGQNYPNPFPNPFNPSTTIAYSIGDRGFVSLKIFDITGREVATLVSTEQDAGSYRVVWDGSNAERLPVSSGVYFFRLQSGRYSKTNKLVYIR